jgi:hypothetical protein
MCNFIAHGEGAKSGGAQRYETLGHHDAIRASRINPGCSHENAAIEARHDSLKTALERALRLRGSRAFTDGAAPTRPSSTPSCSGSTSAWPSACELSARCCVRCRRAGPAEFEDLPVRA